MLPVDGHISWEGHRSGAISGLITALLFRNSGPLPDLPIFREYDSIEPLPEWWALANPDHQEVLAMREAEEKSGNLSAHATSGDSPRVVYRIQKKDE